MKNYMELKVEKNKITELPRYERKFTTSVDCQFIENIIKSNPGMFTELFFERRVNSIYLDSPTLDNYRNHISGNSKRFKIRIRWYGETWGNAENPKLEIKIKNAENGKKMSFLLGELIIDKNIKLSDSLKKSFSKAKLPGWVQEKLKRSFPTLLVSYTRKYFKSCDSKCRITLDKNVIFYRPTLGIPSFIHKMTDRHMKIVEFKYNQSYNHKIPGIISFFPFRLSANSKYVKGIEVYL